MIDNYLEINSINPTLWGKSGWIFLNSIALTYKPEYKNIYKTFFLTLPIVLPCNSCGVNLRKNCKELDIALESKSNLLNWLLKIRNAIYEDNGRTADKKTLKENFDEIFYKPNHNSYIFIFLSSLVLVILIIILYYISNKSKNDTITSINIV